LFEATYLNTAVAPTGAGTLGAAERRAVLAKVAVTVFVFPAAVDAGCDGAAGEGVAAAVPHD
jgi:hypothetical protein